MRGLLAGLLDVTSELTVMKTRKSKKKTSAAIDHAQLRLWLAQVAVFGGTPGNRGKNPIVEAIGVLCYGRNIKIAFQ